MKRDAPATGRNRQPILEVLRPLVPAPALVLEVASGTGQHAAFFAGALPHVVWQPTDVDPEALASIEAHRADAALPNLRPPIVLDAASAQWPVAQADVVMSVNMIHISPWASCEGLVRGASRILAPGGILFLYGPFRVGGALPAPSNLAFDASLRDRNPAWGIRELDDVTALSAAAGLAREAVVEMPANNLSVVFRRAGGVS